jgi:GntR family transcriptional regulator
VRTALRRLEDDGLIERRRARGTFVRRGAVDKLVRDHDHLSFEADLRRSGGDLTVEVLDFEEAQAPRYATEALGVPTHALVVQVRRLGRIAGEPIWLERRYFPHELGLQLSRDMFAEVSANRSIYRILGVRAIGAKLRIDAAAATAEEARQLRVRRGHPVLVSQQVVYDGDQHAFQLMRSVFRGDRYAVTLTLPESSLGPRGIWDGRGISGDGSERLATWELTSV